MIKIISVFALSICVLTGSTFAQKIEKNDIVIPGAGVKKISLDGTWDFAVAKGDLLPSSSAPEAIDAKAKEIAASFNGKTNWSGVAVPQFLNRISWWLPDVSVAYEKGEIERVSKLPEGATTAQGGWYSKLITLPRAASTNEVYVNFEGVALVSRVYLNGHHVGGHLGMFGSFKCRLTPYLQSGEANQLLVYVERGVKSGAGDKIVSVEVSVPVTQNMLLSLNKSMFDKIGPKYNVMGIWLPVTLEVSGAGGRIADVFFDPSLYGHRMEFTMENPDVTKEVSGKLIYTITDKKTGKLLVSQIVNPLLKIAPGKTVSFSITRSGLAPKLWSPDFPNLYIMDVKWTSSSGKLIHQWKDQVGYRTVATQGSSVLLNGKPYWSRGANMPPYGYKPNDEKVARGFLKLMHDGNTVMTRSHGNPWNHMWFTAADEIGIGVSCEGATWVLLAKDIPPAGNIAAWKKETLEMVKQYRNHPSILFYIVSNEGLAQGDDYKNEEKLAIYKDVINDMRKIDNSRLIFQTSGNPDHLGIADIEDTHSYWDWYWSSSYVNDYTKKGHGLPHNDRPFLNHEAAVPYSMIDDGSVHPSYIPRYCAQAWVGDLGVFGGDYSFFQEHTRAVSKLKTEKLRYSRAAQPTAGYMLFSNVTWIQHALTKPVAQWKPFPVYYGVKDAYQPVLVGLTNTQHVFYSGDTLATDVFVVNDDAGMKGYKHLQAVVSFKDGAGKTLAATKAPIGEVAYYAVKRVPLQMKVPSLLASKNDTALITVTLLDGVKTISTNNYPVRIMGKKEVTKTADKAKLVAFSGVAPQVISYLKNAGVKVSELKDLNEKADMIIIGSADNNISKEQIASQLKQGGRAIVLGQGEKAHRLCAEVIATYNDSTNTFIDKSPNREATIQYVMGEFAEMLNYNNKNGIYKGLKPMDWKWWATGNGKPAFVATASHKIKTTKENVIPIGRYLEPHAYWSGNLDEVYKQKIGYPIFAVNYAWGQLVVCDLIIEGAIQYDPRAGQTMVNLLTAEIKK